MSRLKEYFTVYTEDYPGKLKCASLDTEICINWLRD